MIQHYNNETDVKKGRFVLRIMTIFKMGFSVRGRAGASGEEGIAAVMEGTGELVCEEASISSNITTFYAQTIVVALYTFYH